VTLSVSCVGKEKSRRGTERKRKREIKMKNKKKTNW